MGSRQAWAQGPQLVRWSAPLPLPPCQPGLGAAALPRVLTLPASCLTPRPSAGPSGLQRGQWLRGHQCPLLMARGRHSLTNLCPALLPSSSYSWASGPLALLDMASIFHPCSAPGSLLPAPGCSLAPGPGRLRPCHGWAWTWTLLIGELGSSGQQPRCGELRLSICDEGAGAGPETVWVSVAVCGCGVCGATWMQSEQSGCSLLPPPGLGQLLALASPGGVGAAE